VRNLLHCRRGSVAFATVIALVPLIGVVALGTEAGSWYVTRQHAQNAADGAALSGALGIANTNGNLQPNFGTLNGFSSNVTTTQGTYTIGSGFQQGGISPNAVQAVVTQCQPQAGLSLLIFPATATANCNAKNVTIQARAVASVVTPANPPCVLALTGSITFHDSAVTVNAPNCGFASNAPGVGFDFNGNPSRVNVASLTTTGSCSGSSTYCSKVLTYAPPVINPFSALDTAMNALNTSAWGNCSSLTPYTASNPCKNSGGGTITTNGVYFFSGLSLNGQNSLSTATNVQATIILLPGSSLRMVGGTSIDITAQSTVLTSQLPPGLQSVASLLSDVAFYDTESGTPKINGNPNITFGGVFYVPNMDLSFKGHPSITPTNTVNNCSELIAASIEFVGSPTYSNTGCASSVVPRSQYVALVQ
jgi:Flp pilus assembly protein TadG